MKDMNYLLWQKIMLTIKNGDSKIKIAKRVDMTYSSVVIMIDKLSRKGLLNVELKGNKANITLTPKGELVQIKLIELTCIK